jgi:hypothetical protein
MHGLLLGVASESTAISSHGQHGFHWVETFAVQPRLSVLSDIRG